MYRFLFFLAIILISVTLSWWVFIPMAILFVYLAKTPFELIIAGAILDATYYFGDSLLAKNQLAIFSTILIIIAIFLDTRIHWQKNI